MRFVTAPLIVLLLFTPLTLAQQSRTTMISPTLLGSVPQAGPASGSIPLSISDAIDRALKFNLGMILSEQDTRVSRAARLRALSDLLPKVDASVTEIVQQINLAAFGFRGFVDVPPVIGPFSVFDGRARYSQTLLDLKLLHDLRAETERVTAATLGQQDVRELVVLITTDLYLETVSASSRVEAAQSQLRTAQAVFDRAKNLRDSGVVAGIDVLRAEVQFQAQQQRVTATLNDLARQKLNLARAIGLPQAQEFTLTDSLPTTPAIIPSLDEALAAAFDARPDYRRAQALVRAAEQSRKAASSRNLPTVQVYSDYGVIGARPGSSHGTMTFQGSLVVPLYTGERTRAEVLESQSLLEQRQAEAGNLRERIEYEVRTANLDIQSAVQQVRVAQAARGLAQQQLVQAQDRFAAGVTNGLEVTQAQDAVAQAEENYIASVFQLNIAEASLARSMGAAEKMIKSYFGGK